MNGGFLLFFNKKKKKVSVISYQSSEEVISLQSSVFSKTGPFVPCPFRPLRPRSLYSPTAIMPSVVLKNI